MTQQNEARRAAIRAHMAEHDVSYTAALRHFEEQDRSPEDQGYGKLPAPIMEHFVREQLNAKPIVIDASFMEGMDFVRDVLLAEHGFALLDDDAPTPVPAWIDLSLLSETDLADATVWLRRGWAMRDHVPRSWDRPKAGPRGKFLATVTPVGVALTPPPDIGRFPGVVFFRGGGGLALPAYVAGAVTGIPDAAPKAAGYVKRWIAKLVEAAQEDSMGAVRVGWGKASFTSGRALEKIRDYHPSMEKPDATEPASLGPAELDLPWLHLSGLPEPVRADLVEFLSGADPEDSWTAPGARGKTVRELFLQRGADAADVFEFGEGADSFIFGVIRFGDEGAIVVPAALAARTSLPHLPANYAGQARRYGDEVLNWMYEGVYMRRLGYGSMLSRDLSRDELICRPPENRAYFQLLGYAPIRRKEWRDAWKHTAEEVPPRHLRTVTDESMSSEN